MATLINTVDDRFSRMICDQWGNKPENILEILHDVQRQKGYLCDDSLRTIAHAVNVSRAEIQGTVSFYHDFKREKQAKQTLKICRAEACQAVGANELIAEAEKSFGVAMGSHSYEVGLEASYCLGNCALGPAVMIDNELYGRVDIKKLENLSMKHREGSKS